MQAPRVSRVLPGYQVKLESQGRLEQQDLLVGLDLQEVPVQQGLWVSRGLLGPWGALGRLVQLVYREQPEAKGHLADLDN